METTTSFAPLAGRLAAKAAEIRPVDGAAVSWANFMALFWCAIFEMLILLCETLDARAAADARAVAAPAARDAAVAPVLAARPGHVATPRARPVLRVVRVDDAPSTPLARNAAPVGPAAPHPEGRLPAWSPPWPALCWRPPRRVVFFREKTAGLLRFDTPFSLRYHNKMGLSASSSTLLVHDGARSFKKRQRAWPWAG